MFFGATMSPNPPVQIQCGSATPVHSAREIEAQELSDLISSQKPTQILDLRHSTDFPKGRIPGAMSVPAITGKPKNLRDRCQSDRYIVLYSWVGANPSTHAIADELNTLGFSSFILKCGWEGWISGGWPVEAEMSFSPSLSLDAAA